MTIYKKKFAMDNLKRKIETDPDYSDIPELSFKKPRNEENEDLSRNYRNVVDIFQREFQKVINYKREEIHKIQQQLLKAQKTLHLLRYVVVKSFYDRKHLKANNTNEIPVLPSTSTDPNAELSQQNRLHPALKKLVGKKPLNYEPYRTRNKINLNANRFKDITTNNTIKEFEFVDCKERHSETIANDTKKKLCESEELKQDGDIPVRNRDKNKYTILVGNISKWIPSNSSQDNSTHKWMVYVRGPKENPDITNIVHKIRFFLHPSYQPNDIVDIQEAPFHLSRRGWGEFPIRVQIYFKNIRNKPIDIIHNIKLDRKYTGRQTMGGETLVEVWLYDTPFKDEHSPIIVNKPKINFEFTKIEALNNDFSKIEAKFTNKKKKPIEIKTEPEETIIELPSYTCNVINCDTITQFIDNCIENIKELDAMDKETKMIYEENSDNSENKISLSSLIAPEDSCNQENEFLDSPVDNPMSLLNLIGIDQNILKENLPVIKNFEDTKMFEMYEDRDLDRIYLEDHCYTKLINDFHSVKEEQFFSKKPTYVIGKNNLQLEIQNLFDKEKYKINVPLEYLTSISQIVYYLFKHMPLVTELAKDFNYTCMYPYAATSLEQFLSWNSSKQFCAEWYRAKQIKKYLTDNKLNGYEQWTVKIILQFGQAHGFSICPRHELFQKKINESGKTVPNNSDRLLNKNTLTELISVKELLDFKLTLRNDDQENHDIDILDTNREQLPISKIKIGAEDSIPLLETEQNLSLNFIRQTANQIGIKLGPEQVDDGAYERGSENVILKAVMCLSEELIRKSLANCIIDNCSKNDVEITKSDILNVLLERKEFNVFLNLGLGKNIVV